MVVIILTAKHTSEWRCHPLVGPCITARRSAPKPNVTYFRATLFFVAESQNVTLSLPRSLLTQAKRLAADEDTSVSALMARALARLVDDRLRVSGARRRSLAAMHEAGSLGTRGTARWTRDDLHER